MYLEKFLMESSLEQWIFQTCMTAKAVVEVHMLKIVHTIERTKHITYAES